MPDAAEKPKPLRFDTLIRKHRQPKNLVPPYEAVIASVEKYRLGGMLTFGGMRVMGRANVLEHLDLKFHRSGLCTTWGMEVV